jgi:hypothetical protein
MKFVNIETSHSKEELIALIKDNERVNPNMRADERRGKPVMKINEKGNRIKIKCEMIGGASKDNGFLEGTYFKGKIKECDGYCEISGIAVTAPIFHFLMLVLIGVFIYQCITLGGISPIPICIVIFDIFMFWGEFKKQGIIERYIARAARRAEQTK